MYRVLFTAILVTLVVFLATVLTILGNRAGREIQESRRRRRRAVLEPLVLTYAHGDMKSIASLLPASLGRLDLIVLEEVILDHIQRIRGIAMERLSRAYDELGWVDRRISALFSRNWYRRAEAAEKLGLGLAQRATSALVERLEDPDYEVRLRSAKALGTMGGIAAVRPLIQCLTQPTRWSTIRLGDILAGMGPDAAVELMEAFPNLDLRARLTALDILGRIRPLEAGGWLAAKLSDPEPDVRARSAHALGQIGDPSWGPALVRALTDPAWPVRAMAAKALGRLRYSDALPRLVEALRDREWWVRTNAAEAARNLGQPGLLALKTMLDDEDNYARHQAVLMLQEAGVIDAEIANLATTGADRFQAEDFVRRIAATGQTSRLGELSETHSDAEVRSALTRILASPAPVEKAAQ